MEQKHHSLLALIVLLFGMSTAFCRNIKIDSYKIFRQNPGIKACAALRNPKSDIVALRVYQDTGECEGMNRRSADSQTMDDGYAEKIQSVLLLRPTVFSTNNSHFMWTIPGGLEFGYQLDVLLLLREWKLGNSMVTLLLQLAENKLTFLDDNFGGSSLNRSLVFSVSHALGTVMCDANSSIKLDFAEVDFNSNEVAMSFIAQKRVFGGSGKWERDMKAPASRHWRYIFIIKTALCLRTGIEIAENTIGERETGVND